MRCIFCKEATDGREPREHIIPEGLGNQDHILKRGLVCGKCNNYFASKVEKPFLELPAIIAARADQGIPNKKGKVPKNIGLSAPNGNPIGMHRDPKTGNLLIDFSEEDLQSLLKAETLTGHFVAPQILHPSHIISRFLAKTALESLAYRLQNNDEMISEIVDNSNLDKIRNFARIGGFIRWPIAIRRIYPAQLIHKEKGESYHILHEFDFLHIKNTNEWYFVVAIFGQEMVINIGGPSLESWFDWLKINDNKSPLYVGRNASDAEIRHSFFKPQY